MKNWPLFPELETPSVLIDLDVAERNIRRFQEHCSKHGLALRPHIKTHKLPRLARCQLEAGAVGITCQKVSEAEAMVAAGGIQDVLITFNIVGETKLARLRALARRVTVSVVADNVATIEGLSRAFKEEARPLGVLVECDTGAGRCGVQTPQEALALAKAISVRPGLSFLGLMTYPPAGRIEAVQGLLSEAKGLIETAGLPVAVVSNGGSPGMWQAQDVPVATEYRIGTYVYNDRSLEAGGVCQWEDCALSV
ncbi:MAG: alanine racemase, partial [Pseudomonadota bacterium]